MTTSWPRCPAGQQLAPAELPGLGQSGPPLPGSVDPVPVGSIFADRVNSFYVMTQDGLAALTPLQADLLLADQRLRAAYGGGNPSPLPISQAQVTDAVLVPLPELGLGQQAPQQAPELAELPPGDQQMCVRYTDKQVPDIVIGPADPDSIRATGLVQLDTGSGALVAARPNPDTPGTTVYLVTDTGVRYPGRRPAGTGSARAGRGQRRAAAGRAGRAVAPGTTAGPGGRRPAGALTQR